MGCISRLAVAAALVFVGIVLLAMLSRDTGPAVTPTIPSPPPADSGPAPPEPPKPPVPPKPAEPVIPPPEPDTPAIPDHLVIESTAASGPRSAAIIAAAEHVGQSRQPRDQVLAASATSLQVGRVVYLAEPATISSASRAAVQLMLADGTTAFLAADASGLVTGRRVIPGLVYVSGTREYTSVLGAGLTGWVLHQITDAEWDAAVDSIAEREQIDRRNQIRERITQLQASEQPVMTTLTSADGLHQTEAYLLGTEGDEVLLRRTDGTEIRVGLDRLDESSRDTARSRQRELERIRRSIDTLERRLQ